MKILVNICVCLLAVITLRAGQTHAAIDCATLLPANSTDLVSCMRPNDSANATGQFICRRRWVPGVRQVQYQTLCIPKRWGTLSDRCGCCGMVCPQPCAEVCPNPSGGSPGQYGRYIYDHDSPSPTRMCVTEGRTLQMRQQNPLRWQCEEKSSWWRRFIGGAKSPFDDFFP
jgi:hypothetical protein